MRNEGERNRDKGSGLEKRYKRMDGGRKLC